MPAYAPGTPSWVELSSPDADVAATFYGELMGWTATEPGPVEETGGYRMFQQGDKNIGGLMGHMRPGQPTVWSTYISVADADATADKVTAEGGTAVVTPMDVMDIGRMAFFSDPTGAVFGVWQPKTFGGADLVNEPNSLCWNEILTRDADAAKAFYTAGLRLGRDPPVVRRRARELRRLGARRQQCRGHDGDDERVLPARDPGALERLLRGRRLRCDRGQGR